MIKPFHYYFSHIQLDTVNCHDLYLLNNIIYSTSVEMNLCYDIIKQQNISLIDLLYISNDINSLKLITLDDINDDNMIDMIYIATNGTIHFYHQMDVNYVQPQQQQEIEEEDHQIEMFQLYKSINYTYDQYNDTNSILNRLHLLQTIFISKSMKYIYRKESYATKIDYIPLSYYYYHQPLLSSINMLNNKEILNVGYNCHDIIKAYCIVNQIQYNDYKHITYHYNDLYIIANKFIGFSTIISNITDYSLINNSYHILYHYDLYDVMIKDIKHYINDHLYYTQSIQYNTLHLKIDELIASYDIYNNILTNYTHIIYQYKSSFNNFKKYNLW